MQEEVFWLGKTKQPLPMFQGITKSDVVNGALADNDKLNFSMPEVMVCLRMMTVNMRARGSK